MKSRSLVSKTLVAAVVMAGSVAAGISSASADQPISPEQALSNTHITLDLKFAGKHPELNGKRVKQADKNEVFLVMDGRRSWIPNGDVYNRLFKDWNGIETVKNVADIDLGPQMPGDLALKKGKNDPKVFLATGWSKRWIMNPETFNKYYFDWNKIQTVEQWQTDLLLEIKPSLNK